MSSLASTVQKSISSCYQLRGRTQHLLLIWKYCWHFSVPFPFVDWADNAIECKSGLVAPALWAVTFCFVGATSNVFVLEMECVGDKVCRRVRNINNRGVSFLNCRALSQVRTRAHTKYLLPLGLVGCLADSEIHYVFFYTECRPFCGEKIHSELNSGPLSHFT